MSEERERAMRKYSASAIAVLSLVLVGAPGSARAQNDAATTINHIANAYTLVPNITYRTVSNWEAKLDIIQPRGLTAPNPTLIHYHGGGWTAGTKESATISLLPYLQMGWSVVNVEYRLSDVALAPAAVEDSRCALRWVYKNAKQYNFDVNKIVTTGNSAGGHLALVVGMLPASAGLDNTCAGDRSGGSNAPGPSNTDELKVAAVVDWFGITDVNELLGGPNRRSYAVAWLGAMMNREEIAKQVSPMTYVRAGIPPIISVHGDADPTVPYSQKQRFHQALDGTGAAHELVTVPGGKHGGFTDAEQLKNYAAIRAFLTKHKILTGTGAGTSQ
ncbi:MAG: alpha/beta hydrolase fold domain-containing protein [Luteitalea sp.]|nr:alpha/beta hydrolase fold domain-containing protein [Luteitalea sp.]